MRGVQTTMQIDYDEVIKRCLGPKLAYHGFKCSAELSAPQVGRTAFSRNYWCKLQYIIIARVSYTSEAEAFGPESDDLPSEIPARMLDDEPEPRAWLSNRYLSALIGQEYGGIDITRGGLGDLKPFEVLAHPSNEQRVAIMKGLQRNHQWWRFENEADFRNVLQRILDIFITEGLTWFEEQVLDIRRYHQKLDNRRSSELSKIARKLSST